MNYIDSHNSSDRNASQRNQQQSALEAAIEAGDWAAVGEAAAVLYNDELGSEEDASSQSVESESSSIDPERAVALDSLVDAGGW